MSKEIIQQKIELIRNETREGGNTRQRVAEVLTDLNNENGGGNYVEKFTPYGNINLYASDTGCSTKKIILDKEEISVNDNAVPTSKAVSDNAVLLSGTKEGKPIYIKTQLLTDTDPLDMETVFSPTPTTATHIIYKYTKTTD